MTETTFNYNELPFAFLKVNHTFRADESVAAGGSGNTSGSVPLGGLRIRFVHSMEIWTACGDLATVVSNRAHRRSRELTGSVEYEFS